MKGPSPFALWRYVTSSLRLDSFLRRPGDGRKRPQIPAKDLVWGQVLGQILLEHSFHGVQRLARSSARSGMCLSCKFSDDTLGYFNQRLDPSRTRKALTDTLKRTKRNKGFRDQPWLGLAMDGTGGGGTSSTDPVCAWCRPRKTEDGRVTGHRHELAMASLVGARLILPFDVEAYGPGDSEYSAGRRLLKRVIHSLGPRFVQHVVCDAKFGAAPFLNEVIELGLDAIVSLKDNLPDLSARAEVRFHARPPDATFVLNGEQLEVWDDEDFLPWEGLRWTRVRVIRYRQHRRDGSTTEAYWLTSYSKAQVGSLTLIKLAKSRWEIENEGFNEAKTRHGMEHICHHEQNSLVVGWLLMLLAIVIERLYRLCHLHRGNHRERSAADLRLILWLALGRARPRLHDTS